MSTNFKCKFNKTLSAKICSDCNTTLKNMCNDSINKLILAHWNINSIKNKSEFLAEQVRHFKMDILMISKTKIDESFP